jgi:hypothetical protein
MHLAAVSALILLFLSLLISATPSGNRHDIQPSSRLTPRGMSWSRYNDQIYVRKGSTMMERPANYEEDLMPKCTGKSGKIRRCELSCRCGVNGKVLCGTDLGYQFTTFLQRPLPTEKEAGVQAGLTTLCSSICSCGHLPHLTPAHFGFREDEATTSGAGPSSSEAGPSSSGAGPSNNGAGPLTSGPGPSTSEAGRRARSIWQPGPGVNSAEFAASRAEPGASERGPFSEAGPSNREAGSSDSGVRPRPLQHEAGASNREAGPPDSGIRPKPLQSEAGPSNQGAGPSDSGIRPRPLQSGAGPSSSTMRPSNSDAGPFSEAGPSSSGMRPSNSEEIIGRISPSYAEVRPLDPALRPSYRGIRPPDSGAGPSIFPTRPPYRVARTPDSRAGPSSSGRIPLGEIGRSSRVVRPPDSGAGPSTSQTRPPDSGAGPSNSPTRPQNGQLGPDPFEIEPSDSETGSDTDEPRPDPRDTYEK